MFNVFANLFVPTPLPKRGKKITTCKKYIKWVEIFTVTNRCSWEAQENDRSPCTNRPASFPCRCRLAVALAETLGDRVQGVSGRSDTNKTGVAISGSLSHLTMQE